MVCSIFLHRNTKLAFLFFRVPRSHVPVQNLHSRVPAFQICQDCGNVGARERKTRNAHPSLYDCYLLPSVDCQERPTIPKRIRRKLSLWVASSSTSLSACCLFHSASISGKFLQIKDDNTKTTFKKPRSLCF